MQLPPRPDTGGRGAGSGGIARGVRGLQAARATVGAPGPAGGDAGAASEPAGGFPLRGPLPAGPGACLPHVRSLCAALTGQQATVLAHVARLSAFVP